MLDRKEQLLLDAIEPHAKQHGIEIVTVEIVGSKKSPTIRIYIDCEGGVSFDVLSESQKWIGNLIDEIDPFPGAYMLEVSSPGIDRPLRLPAHYAAQVSSECAIKCVKAQNGRANWTGTIVSAAPCRKARKFPVSRRLLMPR